VVKGRTPDYDCPPPLQYINPTYTFSLHFNGPITLVSTQRGCMRRIDQSGVSLWRRLCSLMAALLDDDDFNGHFPCGPGLAGTRITPFLTLLELREHFFSVNYVSMVTLSLADYIQRPL